MIAAVGTVSLTDRSFRKLWLVTLGH